MLFKPRWVRILPPNLRPDERRIIELEELRVKYGIPHEALAMRITSSLTTTRKVQKSCLEMLRKKYPQATEKELLKMVLILRIQAPPYDYGMTEQKTDETMKNINTLDDLCNFIISLDEQETAEPDPLGIGKRIDEILAGENNYE